MKNLLLSLVSTICGIPINQADLVPADYKKVECKMLVTGCYILSYENWDDEIKKDQKKSLDNCIEKNFALADKSGFREIKK